MNDGIAWISVEVAIRVHDEQLRRHGGDDGIRDPGRLESALDRPRNIIGYLPEASLEELAASIAVGIAKGHPFVDGNKRTACVISLMFLRLNEIEISASEAELYDVFIAVADGAMSESDLAQWFLENTVENETPWDDLLDE